MGSRIFVSAGEPSGDEFGARVAFELSRLRPDLCLEGCGGHLMADAGVEIRWDASGMAAMGLGAAILALPAHWRRYREILQEAESGRYAGAVLIDYPGFHLRLGAALRARGLAVVQLVAPQLWAWRPGRLAALAAAADAVGSVLPFEEAWFAARGHPVVPIGHPVVDRVFPDRASARRALGLATDARVLGIFPGSRRAEVTTHWPLMRQIALRLVGDRSVSSAVVAAVRGAEYPEPGVIQVAWERSRDVMRASTAAIVKSGTTTLEAAWAGTPHVLIYRAGRLSYEIVRRQLTIPWIGLANLVARESVVPEFWHLPLSRDAITGALLPLLDEGSPEALRQCRSLGRVREALGSPGVATRAAELVLRVVRC